MRVIPTRGVRLLASALIAAAVWLGGTSAGGQQLQPKRALSPASMLPCPNSPPGPPPARNDSPDVRRLVALGHEAAIVGDHRQARDVFVDAARLSPGDERIAYQLGRAYEELGERQNAVREYCRFLALAPNASDAADVRTRVTALARPATGSLATDPTATAFRTGVAQLDQRRWREAADAFTRVIQALPRASEAYYNRAIALAALEDRPSAQRDFEQYLALRPGAEDQAQVRAQIDALRRPGWNASTALVSGLVIPGLGQAYTGRPWIGLGIAAAAGTSLYFAFRGVEREETHVYSLPPGFDPPTYTQVDTVTKHPYYVAGLAAFASIAAGAAFEAARYARRSRGVRLQPERRPAAARVGSVELFPPDVIPDRGSVAIRFAGTIPFELPPR